jgi:hypothetical protein
MIQLFWVKFIFFNQIRIQKCFFLDLAFAMDCTGSMGSYIESATQNIRSIVEEIVTSEKSDIHLALVEYRDHPPQVGFFFLQGFFFSCIDRILFLGHYIRYSCT